ncbi:serine/arginine repetitive matrix protein 3-like [Orcinus orca]|uniref:serine/arginine repetitive matrix protein 3-like n=1 Tax=Orcinus orca TaxID=9733 RepID=UPI001442758C|nr:serine/arginine repetitive matrix protein 3-like [Orcinus orca]
MGQSQRRGGRRDHRLPEDLTVLRADDDTGSQRQRETGPTGSRRPGGRRRKRRPGPSAERNARRRQRRRRRRRRRQRNRRARRRAAPARKPRAPPRSAPRSPHPVPPIGLAAGGGRGWEESRGARAGGSWKTILAGLSRSRRSARLPPSLYVGLLGPGSPLPYRCAPPCFSHTLACRLPAPHFTRRFTSKHPRPDRPRGGGSPEVWRSAAPAPLGRQLSPRGPRPQLASFSYNALQSIQMFTGNTVDGRTS